MNLGSQSVTLELGDIIELIAPTNPEINQIEAIITYIDETKIKLLNTATAKFYQLNITAENKFTDESITQIHLLNRSDEKGYARQNNLLPRTWIDVHFGGEIPTVITGEVTNLEEDMIEITTFPNIQTIYINFGYRGIPETLPIEKILIREKPASLKSVASLALIRDQLEETGEPASLEEIGEFIETVGRESNKASMEFNEIGESVIHIPETATPDENIHDTLNDLYIDANSVVFGETLEAIAQLVEVPEGQQRYSIEIQINDLLNELLSNIPNNKRTKVVLDNIHLITERFKELRSQYSIFDQNQNIKGMRIIDQHYKPLIDHVKKMDTKLRWLIPVVTNRRKLYDIEGDGDGGDGDGNTPDVISEKSSDLVKKIENIQTQYYQNNSKDQLYYYSNIEKSIHQILAPFENPQHAETQLYNTRIQTDMDVIVDNLEDFYSSVATRAAKGEKNNRVDKTKYLIQRYNLGTKHLEKNILKSGKTVYLSKELVPNDEITVKSLLVLPEPVVRFSAIDMPATNIIDRASIHHQFFMLSKILRKNTEIIPNVIDDLSREFDYEKMEKENQTTFLDGIQEFVINKDINREEMGNNDKFEKFLQVIVPKTKVLVNIIRKYIKNKVSFVSVVQQLEPFMIYPQDITYKQYLAIRYTINKKIEEIKIQFKQKSEEFALLKNAKYDVVSKPNAVINLLSEKKEYIEELFMAYKFLQKKDASPDAPEFESKLSANEMVAKMTESDNSNIYIHFIRLLLISLVSPSSLIDVLAKPNIQDMTDIEKIKPTDCSRRYLAKKYTSIGELQRDNNADDVFFDKDFDDTPYEILNKYKEEQKKTPPELFVDFLAQTLIDKHDCPQAMAHELAKTLIAKKKRVQDGEFAILEIRPQLPAETDESKLSESEKTAVRIEAEVRKKVQYYRRLKNNWIHDDSIDGEAFMDNNELFCNISKDCLKNTKNNVCENPTDTAARMKEIAKRKMLGEFDKRYAVNVDELEGNLNKSIIQYVKIMNKLWVLKETQLYKANNLAFEIGNFAKSTDGLVLSPFLKLRDLIFEQEDFVKKQTDICKFVEQYCRDPIEGEEENTNWKYCTETNTKLVPLSIFRLAESFVFGNNYQIALDEVCHQFGVLSDDGDAIVDKHSGFVLRKIDFSSEEGFDESGFRISTRSIMEEDEGMVVDTAAAAAAADQKTAIVFEDETDQTIYNVLKTVCDHIDIPCESIRDFVMVNSAEFIKTIIVPEKIYKKRSEKREKDKGKPLPPYAEYRDEMIVFIIASLILVSVQTAVPSFRTKKTFPGCVRSFSGYPMDGGAEDITGIQYIACVLKKTASSVKPWVSVRKYTVPDICKRMKQTIETSILPYSGMEDLYTKKRNYILLTPDPIAPEEHSVSKWRNFLPPVVSFEVAKHLKNVTGDFITELAEVMKKGKNDQFKMIHVLQGKIAKYGYGIIELINATVKSKMLILKTTTDIPFLENACCNESELVNPYKYFKEADENIQVFTKIVAQLGKRVKDIDRLTTAGLLYNDVFTGFVYPDLPTGQLEDTIYEAVIKYCNLDKDTPIPADFLGILNEKPAFYNKGWTIQEKVEFFKKNGKRYGIETLHQLMMIVFNRNKVTIEYDAPFTQVDAFKDILFHEMEMSNSAVCVERLCAHVKEVVDTYNPNVMKDVESEELNKKLNTLKDYLFQTNRRILDEIMAFFKDHGNKMSKKNYTKIKDFLTKIADWDETRPSEMHSFTKFIENAVYSFSKVYPSIILNGNKFLKTVPAHWGFSDFHCNDIATAVGDYYSEINEFKADETMMNLLRKVEEDLSDVVPFMQNIPVYSELKKMVETEEEGKREHTFCSLFDVETTRFLFTYCFYSSIYQYIVSSDDKDLLNLDIEIYKMERRASIAETRSANLSTVFSAEGGGEQTDLADMEDEDADIQEVTLTQTDIASLKKKVCSLLLAFINIEIKNKDTTALSYLEIKRIVNRSKNEEKKKIMTIFKDMDNESRRVENSLKELRIGSWNVGQQKSLFQYDPDTYDKERENVEFEEMNAREIDDFDDPFAAAEQEEEEDIYGLNGVGEDFMDGAYYDEDRETEFPDDS